MSRLTITIHLLEYNEKLTKGSRYLTRSGDTTDPVRRTDSYPYSFKTRISGLNTCYAENGSANLGEWDPDDLIAEIIN